MPGENGVALVRHVSENFKGVGTLVITGFPSIQGAVESIKKGAEDYLVKPFTDEELFKAVDRVLAKTSKTKKRDLPESSSTFGMIGNSERIQEVSKLSTRQRIPMRPF
jgi:DNA-binding NtrC family response regulator